MTWNIYKSLRIKTKNVRTKIKFCGGKINTNFHDKKLPKKGSNCVFLKIIVIDLLCNMKKKYYPQVFLEKWKYEEKKIKKTSYITECIEISSVDGDYSDEEN